ncbi:MAG: hypothetical protein JWN04_4750 [Myxococcaceae bacterium]|nr:hypothetical protein [Myxococcaceae bacterium]
MFAVLVGLLGLLGSAGCGDDGGSSSSEPAKDAAVEAGKSDAKVTNVHDTGVTKPPTDGGGVPSTNPALDAIAGRYLMRWDTFGTGSTLGVSIRSRVSVLIVTELMVDGDHLTATEQICNQSAKQKCLSGCNTATTTVDKRVIDNFLHQRQFTREYTLGSDGRAITAGLSTAELGYDGDGPLPTSSSDPSVWDVITDQNPREGMLTSLLVTNVGFGGMIKCDVYGVQKFVTKFSGTLGGSASAPTFPSMVLTFTTDTAAGRLGSTNPTCDAAGDSPLDNSTVQLVRYGDGDDNFWNCYGDSVFDAQLPATADSVIDANP